MRYDQIRNLIDNGLFAAEERFLTSLINSIDEGLIAKGTDNAVDSSHSYEKISGVALITVDGTMIKANSEINALCGGFIPYTKIESYTKQAETDSDVHTIVYKVDTNGGDVNGVDNVGEMIASSKKRTVTFYNNAAYSAGIWAFSGADELYASRTTSIGSIGVLAAYREPDKESQHYVISRNATNKLCSINGDCKDKIQTRINAVENIFLSRVERNTGMSRTEIVNGFKDGGTILAEEAKTIGFLDGVMSFSELMNKVATMPTVPLAEKIEINTTKGDDSMAITQKEFDAVQAKLDAATAENKTLAEANKSDKDGAVTALDNERARMKACLEVIPSALHENADVMAMVTDGKSSVNDVKAAMFDISTTAKAEVVKSVIEAGADVNKAAAKIETNIESEAADEDSKESADALALAKEMEGIA